MCALQLFLYHSPCYIDYMHFSSKQQQTCAEIIAELAFSYYCVSSIIDYFTEDSRYDLMMSWFVFVFMGQSLMCFNVLPEGSYFLGFEEKEESSESHTNPFWCPVNDLSHCLFPVLCSIASSFHCSRSLSSHYVC